MCRVVNRTYQVSGQFGSKRATRRHLFRHGGISPAVKGGDPIWVDLTVAAVWDDADAFSYAIAVVRDVSERRAAEAALADRGRHLADAEA
jgi:hypothetical protein